MKYSGDLSSLRSRENPEVLGRGGAIGAQHGAGQLPEFLRQVGGVEGLLLVLPRPDGVGHAEERLGGGSVRRGRNAEGQGGEKRAEVHAPSIKRFTWWMRSWNCARPPGRGLARPGITSR